MVELPDGRAGADAGAARLVIEFRDVAKTYRSITGRTVRAVDGISFEIRRGEVFGLAGPNGAGKSTLINLLLGYLTPTTGEVRIAGDVPRAFVERHGIGYLSELVNIPPRWPAEQALVRYAVLAGVPAADVASRVQAVIERLGLEEHRSKRIKALSKGNLQRVGLAQAMLRDEQVLVLDEPTHGLDPVWTQRFRDIVDALRHPDRAILIASHNLDELQRLADRVAIIDHGKLQRVVGTAALQGAGGATAFRLSVAHGGEHVEAVFPGAVSVARGEYQVSVADLSTLNAGVATLLARGVLLAGITPAHSALEQQFREAVGEPA